MTESLPPNEQTYQNKTKQKTQTQQQSLNISHTSPSCWSKKHFCNTVISLNINKQQKESHPSKGPATRTAIWNSSPKPLTQKICYLRSFCSPPHVLKFQELPFILHFSDKIPPVAAGTVLWGGCYYPHLQMEEAKVENQETFKEVPNLPNGICIHSFPQCLLFEVSQKGESMRSSKIPQTVQTNA